MTQDEASWREFERAVAKFAAAMDPLAKVQHDVTLPDRHSHRPRQRDVWSEAKICQHFPVAVLVSCKRWRKKIDQGHIDAFCGELASSRAHKGVIYSYSGFTKPALEKASELGLCCCRLYQGEPPEIPECLLFHTYHCRSRISLTVAPVPATGWGIETWQDLFDIWMNEGDSRRSVIDNVVEVFLEAEKQCVREAQESEARIPQPFDTEFRIPTQTDQQVPIRVIVHGTWSFYRAKLEAYLLKGSYSFTSGEYAGEMATPAVDRLSTHPGPGWELMDEPPDDLSRSLVLVFCQGGVKKALIEHLAQKHIGEAANQTLEPRANGDRAEG